MGTKASGRLKRSLDRLERRVPAAAGVIRWLRRPRMSLVRIPLALLLILGGLLSFLPILGIWMLPLGLVLLALDLAVLQDPVGRSLVEWRRRLRRLQRRGHKRK